jgi:hypothetical protein
MEVKFGDEVLKIREVGSSMRQELLWSVSGHFGRLGEEYKSIGDILTSAIDPTVDPMGIHLHITPQLKAAISKVEAQNQYMKYDLGNTLCDAWLLDADKEACLLSHPLILPCEDGQEDTWRELEGKDGHEGLSYIINHHYENNSGRTFDMLCSVGRYYFSVKQVMLDIAACLERAEPTQALVRFNTLLPQTAYIAFKVVRMLTDSSDF